MGVSPPLLNTFVRRVPDVRIFILQRLQVVEALSHVRGFVGGTEIFGDQNTFPDLVCVLDVAEKLFLLDFILVKLALVPLVFE